jgi:hypothetical protein
VATVTTRPFTGSAVATRKTPPAALAQAWVDVATMATADAGPHAYIADIRDATITVTPRKNADGDVVEFRAEVTVTATIRHDEEPHP